MNRKGRRKCENSQISENPAYKYLKIIIETLEKNHFFQVNLQFELFIENEIYT